MLYVCNVEEGSAATGNDYSRRVEARAKQEGAGLVVISAKIEAEIAVLPPDGARRISRRHRPQGSRPRPPDPRRLRPAAPRDLLHRRAEGGARLDDHARREAPQAAGVIHTDFERGFIRAETIAYDDYVTLGGEAGARDAGRLRLEGKDYVVADGDVMHFRFAT